MNPGMNHRSFTWLALGLVLCLLTAAPGWAELNTADPSIINLYLLNEQTSGPLTNFVVSFYDTAPTGTAQNHDTFSGSGPYWGTGADFEAGGVAVGTGTGLTFDRSNGEHTRHAAWLTTSQGNYNNGDSYTAMTRVFATEAIDNTFYHTLGSYAHYIQFQGISTGDRLTMLGNVRGGTPNETHWNLTSQASGGGITGSTFFMETGKWYNAFLIYEQNTALTLAIDDGATFDYIRSTDVPAGFDTITNGFGDPFNSWALGTFGLGGTDPNTFDGRMESVVYFDKALSLAEADAIDLANGIPLVTTSFTNVNVNDVIGMEFGSVSGLTYNLEFAEDPATNDWMAAGATLSGNDGNLIFFDPTGFSTQRVYRILVQ